LIKDYYPYNWQQVPEGMNWVGDLAVECELETDQQKGRLILELVKAGRAFQARFDLERQTIQLQISGETDFAPESVRQHSLGSGKQRLLFANIDHQLWLLIDGQPVEFNRPTTYSGVNDIAPFGLDTVQPGDLTPNDFVPVGIAVQGTSATVSGLRVLRDVFYTNTDSRTRIRNHVQLLDSPDDSLDQFFMLGDNSPSSSDSRYWSRQGFAERRQLIGKAVYIYWPHSWPATYALRLGWNGTGWNFEIPFWPNWERMRLIR
jgi:signal peptidase I